MARNWNLTGLYKASRDRMPGKRSRKIIGTPPAAKLVKITPDPQCGECGFGLTTNAHRLYCGKADPYDAGSDMNSQSSTLGKNRG